MKQRLILILSLLFTVISMSAQSVKDLQKQQKKLQEEIEQTNKMIKQTKSNEKATENKLTLIGQGIQSRKKLINNINGEITALNREMNRLTTRKGQLQTQLDSLRTDYARLIRMTHYADLQQSPLLFLISSGSFDQLLRRLRYLQEFARYRQQQVRRIEGIKADIEIQNELLEDNKKEKQSALKVQKREHENLARDEKKQQQMLKELKKKEKDLVAQQKQKQKKVDELNAKIEKMIAAQVSRKEKLTKEQELIAGGFEANKGRLPWPVANGFISGQFGKHPHPIYENVTINNKGIYLQTTAGTDARAVYEGEVTSCMVLGNTYAIIIQHGNYRTVYTGLEKTYVKAGDKVKSKQAIGKIYSDAEQDNKTELQFQVWRDRDLLNPALWLAQ